MRLNQNQQEALNAAMLAKMVGVEMQKVDGLTIERGSNPANKIDINRFIAPIKGNKPIPNQANMGYIPESVIQQMVPDTTSNQAPPVTVGVVTPVQHSQAPQVTNSSVSNEDIKAIRGHLERISSNLTKLTGMFGKIYCNALEKEKK